MTTPVIQELTIDARGAQAGSALYVRAMQSAQSAVDRLIDRERLQQVQQQAGVAVTEQAAQSTSRLAAAFDKLRGSVDPATKLQITHQREIERAMLTTDAAVRRGLSTQEQAAKVLTQLRARQLADVTALTAAENRHTSAVIAGNAANDNRHGTYATANIAAQFQDIAVTSAMGMNPLQIALQQGTQLSAVLGGQGLTGVVKSLGAAFAAILSPVSLLTIGVVALGSMGIQSLMGIMNSGAKANETLAEQSKRLDDLLFGYDEAAKAAKNVADEAKKLPAGVVASNLRKSLKEEAAAAEEFAASLRKVRNQADSIASTMGLGAGISRSVGKPDLDTEALIAQLRVMQEFSVDTKSTSHEIDVLMTATKELFNTTDNAAIRDLANDFYELAARVRESKAEIEATEAASRKLQSIGNININISIRSNLDAALSGMEKIKALTPDLRTEYQKVDDALSETLLANSNLPSMLRQTMDAGAKQAATTAKATLDLKAAQDEAAKAAAAGSKESAKLNDAYADLVDNTNRRIASARLEAEVSSMSEQAAGRLRMAHDLLSQAEQAGVKLDADKRAELTRLATTLADTEFRTKSLAKAQQDQISQSKQLVDTFASAVGSLFSKPVSDAREFFSIVMGGFAQLGQSNLKNSLQNLFTTGSAANDNGNSTSWVSAQARVFGDAVRVGAKDGTKGGFSDLVKNIPGGAGTLSAGLGGLGIGYQTQNPLMGALGGALSGAAAGPWGAVIGGIAGLVGGFLGMNEALDKARKEVDANRDAINQFIATGFGREVSKYSSALAAFNQQGAKLIELAKAAGDSGLVAQINAAMAAYRSTLGTQFREDLDASVNNLSGRGYLNDVAAAQKAYNQRLSDAAMLGVSAAGAADEFSLSLQKIVLDADLTADQLNQLAAAFPALTGQIQRANGALIVRRAEESVETERQNLRDAYEREASALRDVVDHNKAFIASIEQVKSSLSLDANLSTLSPLDRLAVAQGRFSTVSAAALGGDQGAQAQLEQAARDYLELARGAYASSEQYVAIFGQVQSVLDQAMGAADGQMTTAEAQLEQIKTQTGLLIDLNTNTATVAQSIFSLNMAIVTLAGARSTYGLALGGMVPGYAGGGIIGNGMWNRDSVLARYAGGGAIALAGGEHVTRAPSVNRSTRSTLDYINRTGRTPGAEGGEVVAELRAINDRLGHLESTVAAGANLVREGVDEGNAALTDIAHENRQSSLRRAS